MTSQKEDILKSLQNLKRSKIHKRNISVRASKASIAAMLAKELDLIIDERRVRPNIKGEYIFAMRLKDVLRFIGKTTLDSYFRRIMKEFGYRFKIRNKEIEIIRFSK